MDKFSNHPLYRRHNIDSAMNSLWDFYKSRFVPLFIISLAMSLIIQYASTMVDVKELSGMTDPLLMFEKLKSMIVPILIISLVSLLFNTVLQYYIIYNPIDSTNNILVSSLKSMKYFIPYLIIIILWICAASISIVIGIFALIVGAFFALIYAMTLYLIILPVLIVEETNIANAISRTFSLTHRNFWSNMGWVAVFIMLILIISVLLSSLILIPFSGSFLKSIFNPQDASNIIDVATNPLFIILSAIINALTLPLMPLIGCVLYFNGKASEEQLQPVDHTNQETERVRVEDLYAKPYSDDHPDNPEKNV